MISIFSAEHERHAPPHEWLNGELIGAHESPRRAAILHSAIMGAALGPILPAREFGLEPVRAVHSPAYLAYLEHAYERWVAAGGAPAAVLPDTFAVRWMGRASEDPLAAPGYYAYDLSAPIVPGTYQAARAAANVALTGAALLLEGHRATYALCRPPGHHAGTDMCGGYCFLNNAAIAAQYLLSAVGRNALPAADLPSPSAAGAGRVAILDIDFHHGNGTQQTFYTRDDVLVISLHADPARQYPYFAGYADERGAGAGLGYNLNIPLEAGVADERYLQALEEALLAIAESAPHFLVLSAGFDTFGGDPVGDFALTTGAYSMIGQRIATLGLPTLIVQEGGYAIEALGENVVALLRGFEA